MRILFINHTFPGIFGDLAAAFGGDRNHETVFVSSHGQRQFMAGVTHMPIFPRDSRRRAAGKPGDRGRELENALADELRMREALASLEREGFVPDMVLASGGGCCGLFWDQVFPASFRVSWAEGRSTFCGLRLRTEKDCARQLIQCRQALTSHLFVSLTAGRESFYSRSLACAVDLPYAVNTDWFAPNAAEKLLHGDDDLARARELVVFVVGRDSASEAGIMTAALLLLAERPDCHVVMLCGGTASITSLKEKCRDMPQIAPGRIHLVGRLSLRNYRNLLSLAAMLVFPAGGDVPPSIMLEAMSCGAALVVPAGSAVPPLMRNGENIFLAARGTPDKVARNLAMLLENAKFLDKVRARARETVLRNFDSKSLLPEHMGFLLNAYDRWKKSGGE